MATGSISVSGLLGGTAGQIDTNALVSQLMQAASLPQTQLKNQLSVQQAIVGAYQGISSAVSALQTAAQALTDPTAWTATAATSSSSAVVATSTGAASPGATTFDVLALATAQISTVAVAANGTVLTTPTNGFTITGSDGVAHTLTPTSGSAADVATAVNGAGLGVRATVVTTDTGQVLQLTAGSTGTKGAFTVAGLDSPAQTVVAAGNAQIGVGTVGAGGYTVSSQTNSFTGVIPGVTFSVGALATGVTISVASDEQSISDKVKALVNAANAANSAVNAQTAKGAILAGYGDVVGLQQSITGAVSTSGSGTLDLSTYGITIDKLGVYSFDAAAFAKGYAAGATTTQTAITSFASRLDSVAGTAVDPTTGTVTSAISSATAQETTLNKQIGDWTTRLDNIQTTLQAKYTAMETALAKLQSQQSYLTNMFNSMNGTSSSSSGSSSSG